MLRRAARAQRRARSAAARSRRELGDAAARHDRHDVRRLRRAPRRACSGRERVKELSQWLAERDGDAPARERRAVRPPAHRPPGLLPPAQRPRRLEEPRALIARLGEYVELPSAAACCGAAGTYALLRPEDSARVLDRHLDEIAAADLDAIVVVNPGCYRQLEQGVKRRGLRTRVVHIAELAAEAL